MRAAVVTSRALGLLSSNMLNASELDGFVEMNAPNFMLHILRLELFCFVYVIGENSSSTDIDSPAQ